MRSRRSATTTATDLVEVYYADLGRARPTPICSPSFFTHRVVRHVHAVPSNFEQAEGGEIRYQGQCVPVYRRVWTNGRGHGHWMTDKVRAVEPPRITYLASYLPEQTSAGNQGSGEQKAGKEQDEHV